MELHIAGARLALAVDDEPAWVCTPSHRQISIIVVLKARDLATACRSRWVVRVFRRHADVDRGLRVLAEPVLLRGQALSRWTGSSSRKYIHHTMSNSSMRERPGSMRDQRFPRGTVFGPGQVDDQTIESRAHDLDAVDAVLAWMGGLGQRGSR